MLVVEAKRKTSFIGALLDNMVGSAGLLAGYIAEAVIYRHGKNGEYSCEPMVTIYVIAPTEPIHLFVVVLLIKIPFFSHQQQQHVVVASITTLRVMRLRVREGSIDCTGECY